MGCFAEVYRRRNLKVNAGKSKVIVLGGDEGLEYEVYVDGIRLEHVSEFKYFRCVYMNQVLMRQSIVGGLLMLGICSLIVLV